ncbi:uncharacterized protein LOC110462341 [Mizuhopecten yessoensis]|uniref:Uncharacterized protein n=1 Tax=Mizuhopecten yessoensis TaxID=6573 RepID=A0A210PYK6_MIZYE|nr:uncharacterized protein LOC110462341 [Mizuhopecten yessoensis]OWF41519.1 hypothetical protein KP79_PYT17408 [Mizuhopecten yessoensis]
MVKSTVQESLDEAFEQRLTIMDEPWAADYRFAESRLSRRDQHSLRHVQRRPSSEVRNRIKQRKPLPENKHECCKYEHVTNNEERGILGTSVTSPIRLEHEAYTAKEFKHQHFLDGASFNDSVGTCVQPTSASSTCPEVGVCCDHFLPPKQSCPQNNHAWASTTGNAPAPRHSSTTLGKRHGEVIEVKKPGLKHPDSKESSTYCVQNYKRRLTNSSKIVTPTKTIRNIECKGNEITHENKDGFKRQREHGGEAHFSGKRSRPQLWLRHPKNDEFEDMTDEINVVVDSRTAMLSSLQEPQTHSHQFKRTLVKSDRVRH